MEVLVMMDKLDLLVLVERAKA
jgi:hypothetical protein